MKKVLAIYDEDSLYSSRLLTYICRSKDFKYLVLGYTNKESLLLYLENSYIDILLVEENKVNDLEVTEKIKYTIVLADGRHEAVRDLPSIYKYQSADNILNEICRITQHEVEEETKCKSKDTSIYTVYSPSHESYHMAYSYIYANYLSQNIPTLYVDLSLFSRNYFELSKEQQGLSELIYYLKQGDDISERLKEVIVNKNQLSYLCGVKYAFDLLTLTKEEVRRIMKVIIDLGKYQAVVINLSMFSDIVSELLTLGDAMLLITNKTNSDQIIMSSFLNQMVDYFGKEIKEKIEVVPVNEEEMEELMEQKIPLQQSRLWMKFKGEQAHRRIF